METKTGQVVVVTGAGSGIGRACALGLLAAGYRVALAGRKAEALAATASEAGAAAGRALVVPTDVTDPAAVNALFARVGEAFGRVDVLFNNAGVNAPPVALEDLAVDEWRRGCAKACCRPTAPSRSRRCLSCATWSTPCFTSRGCRSG